MSLLCFIFLMYSKATSVSIQEEEQFTDIRGEYSYEDIETVYDQYIFHLKSTLEDLSDEKLTKYYIKDISIDKNHLNETKNILVWDLGGSFFKLCYVTVSLKDGKIEGNISHLKTIPYPKISDATTNTFWEDWATDQMFNFILDKKIVPDSSSLIVSYPLQYDGKGDASVEQFTKFFCFNRGEEAKKRKIIQTIRNCIEEKLEEFLCLEDSPIKELLRLDEPFGISNCVNRLGAKTVLNDSVANYFSSKYQDNSYNIGIILGTGTNAAFPITYKEQQYVHNSEWGAFVPKNIHFWKEEQDTLNSMRKKFNVVNCLDVIAGNGNKFELLNLCAGNDKEPICKDNLAKILKQNQDPRSALYKTSVKRSKQLICALTLAVIYFSQANNILIITNGSGFDTKEDNDHFMEVLEEYKHFLKKPEIEIILYNDEGLTLKGSALYTFYHCINEN